MTRAKLTFGFVVATAIAAVAGCASMDALDSGTSARNPGGEPTTNGENKGDAPGASGSLGPTGNGVILVHAAKYYPFRLCFENQMTQRPQPDETIMPEANVVGLEVGSAVRLEPLPAPGRILVIREASLRGKTGTCQELLNTVIFENLDFQYAQLVDPNATDAGPPPPLGTGKVQILALSGCGGGAFLPPNTTKTDCGSDYNNEKGNLKASVVDIAPSTRDPSKPNVPVQLVHLSSSLEARKVTAGGGVEVTFGELKPGTAPLPETVAADPKLLAQSEQVMVGVSDKESIFATHGFRIAIRLKDGGAPISTDQSLADVQELSAPRDNPTSYYRAGSNYALLLLGDPAAFKTLDGGVSPPDPTFSRRGVHLLAIPVIDPTTVDAGAGDGGTRPDGG